jgi:glycosyltransferase involved in cell wall biosynthesis
MKRRLSILSVCRTLPNPDDPSGGIFVLNRIAAMAEQADVRVVQPVPFLPLARRLPHWARSEDRALRELQVMHAPMLSVPGVFKSADAMWLARSIHRLVVRLHKEKPIDAIDAHFGYPEGAGCMRVARRLGIPCYITVRGFENEYVHQPGVGPRMLAALRESSGCISVSHSLKELLIAHGVQPQRVCVIHNAIDAETFRYADAAQARASLDIQPQGPLIVSVGHLVSRKRHHVLVRAFAELRETYPGAQLVIIGAPSFERRYPGEIASLARELGVEHAVGLRGNIPPSDVALWLQAADVFALATAREGCCNAVLEALAVGAPTVTTAVGDNAHFVKNGVNGYIVNVDDAADLARGLRAALSKRWNRQAISQVQIDSVGSWRAVGGRVLDFMRNRMDGAGAIAA